MTILFSLYLIMTFSQQDYEILEKSNSRVGFLLNEFISVEECKFNSASIYRLQHNKFLISPKAGKYLLIYNDRAILDEHIKNKYFPIQKPETDSLFESEKEKIINIDSSIDFYINYVVNMYKIDLKNFDLLPSDKKLALLNEKIHECGLDSLNDFDILAIGFFTSQIFKDDTKSNWNLDLVYTLNTYWAPSLVIEKSKLKFDLIGCIFKSIKEEGYLDLNFCYRKEKAKFYGLKLFSKEYMDFITNKGNGPD